MENKLVVANVCEEEGRTGVNIKERSKNLYSGGQFCILIAVLVLQITHMINGTDMWNFKGP